MRRKALSMVLSEKAKNNLLIVMDAFDISSPAGGAKTKGMAMTIKNLPIKTASRLVVSQNADKNVFLAARNIAKTGVSEARNLNVVDLLNYKYVLVSKGGIKDIEKTFAK